MPLLTVMAASFLSLLIPLLLGYFVTALIPLPAVSRREQLAWRMTLGLAASITLLTYLGPWFSVRQYAWWVVAALLLLLVLCRQVRRDLLQDFHILRRQCSFWLTLLILGGVVCLALSPIVGNRQYVNFSGTYNNDNYLYVSNAQYAMDNPYRLVPGWQWDRPSYRRMDEFAGWRRGHFGAESYLAFIATLLGQEALLVYQPVFATFYFFWIAAGYLLLKQLLGPISLTDHLRPRYIWGLFLALQPLFLFTFANGNYNNLVGVCLAGPLIIRLRRMLLLEPDRRGLLHVALLLNALLATYGELLPGTVALAGLCVLEPLFHAQWRRLGSNLIWATITVFCGLLINPFNALRGIMGLLFVFNWTSYSSPPNIMQDLEPGRFLPTIFGMFVWKIRELPLPLSWVITCALLLTLGFGLWRCRDRWLAGTFILLLAMQWLMIERLHFGYGRQKTIQYWSLYLIGLLAVGFLGLFESSFRLKIKKFYHYLLLTPVVCAAGISLLWLGWLMRTQLRDMYHTANDRHTSQSLHTMARSFPPSQGVLLRVETFSSPSYNACFLPLLLREHPTFFPLTPSPYGPMWGYLDDPGSAAVAMDNASALPQYVLYGKHQPERTLIFNSHPLISDPEFTLDQPLAYVYLSEGAIIPAGNQALCGLNDLLQIEVFHLKPVILKLELARVPDQPLGNPQLSITVNEVVTPITFTQGTATATLHLTKPGAQFVTLKDLLPTNSGSPPGFPPSSPKYLIRHLTIHDPTVTPR